MSSVRHLPGQSKAAYLFRVKKSQVIITSNRGYGIPDDEADIFLSGLSLRDSYQQFIARYGNDVDYKDLNSSYLHTGLPKLLVSYAPATGVAEASANALILLPRNERTEVYTENLRLMLIVDGESDIGWKPETRYQKVEVITFNKILTNPVNHIYASRLTKLEADDPLKKNIKDVLAANGLRLPTINTPIDPLPLFLNAEPDDIVLIEQDNVYCSTHQEASIVYRRVV